MRWRASSGTYGRKFLREWLTALSRRRDAMAVPESRHQVGPATPNGRRHSNAEWDFPFALPGRWQGKKKIPANTERRQPWVDPDAVDPTHVTPRFVRARIPLAGFLAQVKTIADDPRL